MDPEMEGRLYEAAIEGNVSLLGELLHKDPCLLDKAMFGGAVKEHPLHIASQFGHLNFVREILARNREFARKLNSRGESPLHVAAEKGHLEVVKELTQQNADVCFVRDGEGRTPLHVAARRGRLKVLEELLRVRPVAAWVLTDGGDPILHLCANHGQFEALKFLVETVEDKEFLKLKDRDDNTIFHLLIAKGKYEDIKLFIDRMKTERDVLNSVNNNGCTALDMVKVISRRYERFKIRRAIRKVGAMKAKQVVRGSRFLPKRKSSHFKLEMRSDSDHRSNDALMVVAIIIATVTYGGVLNPPGGVWEEDEDGYIAGRAIMSNYFPVQYVLFTISNTVGFLVSVILMLVLVSGSSFRKGVLKRFSTVMTWIAVSSLVATYSLSFYILAADNVKTTVITIGVILLVFGWTGITALLVFVFLLRSVKSLLLKHGIKRLLGWLSTCLCRLCSDSDEQSASLLHRQTELQVVTDP